MQQWSRLALSESKNIRFDLRFSIPILSNLTSSTRQNLNISITRVKLEVGNKIVKQMSDGF